MKRLKYIGVFLFPVFVMALIFYGLKNIKITEISCHSQYGECSSLVKDRLNNIEDCDYFSCTKNIDKVLSDAWIVNDYHHQLKIPLRIEVNLVEKKPIFSIKSEINNLVIQVDSEGLVLDVRERSVLPGFFIDGNLPSPGEKVKDNEFFALQIIYGTSKIQEIETARLEKDHLSVDMKDGKRILFPLEGDRDFILGSLALILNELKKSSSDTRIGEGQIKIVDLRYKNPILR